MEPKKNKHEIPNRTKEERRAARSTALQKLLDAKTGGFSAIATSVDGAEKMDPAKAARRNMFLIEDTYGDARRRLRNRIAAWIGVLNASEHVADMAEQCRKTADSTSALLQRNLLEVVKAGRPLERAYRTVDLFFKNTGKAEVRNLTLLNISPDQMRDLDSPNFIHAVRDELDSKFNKLDLRGNYSLLVAPGYLGSKMAVNYWADFAFKNKVFLITDYRDFDDAKDAYEAFCEENLATADPKLSNVIMASNYLLGRPAYRADDKFRNKEEQTDWKENLGENDALWIGPAGPLAGRMYRLNMAQVAAGKKWGQFLGVQTVRFEMAKSHLSDMVKANMVPVVFEWNQVSAFSDRTLFTGEPIGMQTYSVVRVFDWVMKVLMDFGNRIYGENLTDFEIENSLRPAIVKFLDKLKHDWKFIANWGGLKVKRDPENPKRILLEVRLDPLWPTETLLITLDGMQGDDGSTVDYNAGMKSEAKK